MVSVFLMFVTITNCVFVIMNIQYLVMLKSKPIKSFEACEIEAVRGDKRVIVEGYFIGALTIRKRRLLTVRQCSIGNDITIVLPQPSHIITNLNSNISFGNKVRVLGYTGYIENNFVLCNIKYLTTMDEKSIKKYLNKRYTVASIISMLIMLAGGIICTYMK